jgi:hypothetical protein
MTIAGKNMECFRDTPEKKQCKKLTPYQLQKLTEMLNAYADWLETNHPEPKPKKKRKKTAKKTAR